MLKALLVAIGSFVLRIVFTILVLSGVYRLLGTDPSFEPDSYEPSLLWVAVMFVTFVLAAMLAGFVAAKAGGGSSVLVLVVLVLVVDTYQVMAFETPDDRPETRPAVVSGQDAMLWAESATWVDFAQPILGVIGVALGAGMAGKGKKKK